MSRGGGKDQASYLLSLPNMLRDYDNGKRDILTLPKELYLRNCRLAFLAPVEFGVSFRRREGFEFQERCDACVGVSAIFDHFLQQRRL